MTRFKDYILAAFAMLVSLAALGLFASMGLAVLGFLAVIGLVAAAASWVTTALAQKPDTASA